jgi:hypothetical protein
MRVGPRVEPERDEARRREGGERPPAHPQRDRPTGRGTPAADGNLERQQEGQRSAECQLRHRAGDGQRGGEASPGQGGPEPALARPVLVAEAGEEGPREAGDLDRLDRDAREVVEHRQAAGVGEGRQRRGPRVAQQRPRQPVERGEREQVQPGHQQLGREEGGGQLLRDEAGEGDPVLRPQPIEPGLHRTEQRQQRRARVAEEQRRLAPGELVGGREVEAAGILLSPRPLAEDGVAPGAAGCQPAVVRREDQVGEGEQRGPPPATHVHALGGAEAPPGGGGRLPTTLAGTPATIV